MGPHEKYAACVQGLKSYAANAGFTEAVIGLSGGIDSAVAAVMAADAFGAERVHGVLLPGPYSSDHSVDDAQQLADNLGIDAQTISILEPFEAFERVLAKACGGELKGLAAENTQARCRMVCLMALSNAYGWMLVNTGNKSEAMMGYSTLYGDTAGAFAPMGGLYKTDVYAVGRWRNEQALRAGEVPPIPENIFIKPPSAELAPDQQDEKSLGIAYSQLDRILVAQVEQGKSVEEIVREGIAAQETVLEVLATVERYAFKRAMEPPFPSDTFYR
ncbi:NAD(+) synthase [Raoultibacter phocaeensis]|uniref:NAD(+) synthase n=1 Tax=Raoultibacter phocaeensis TaxID=2479841 RepID=UPI00111A3CCF|nr:NAD(+) synthase [Raoultibacter phocaeensis]